MEETTQTYLKVYESIDQNLSLDHIDTYNEDELIRIITSRVQFLIDNDKDLLMSYLYRLDIPNNKIQAALRITNEVPIHVSLGLLIYYRQLERIRTKLKYKQKDIGEDWA
ncbi:MAG TPA: hypothetical protein PKD85_03195 [Saprospiraceae bacterium]|nr:hypothetical protein [Saprospiraceae bacterium]